MQRMARTTTRLALTAALLALFLLALAPGLAAAEDRVSGTVVTVDAPECDTGTVSRDPDGAIVPFEDPLFPTKGLDVGDCVTFVVFFIDNDPNDPVATDLQPCEISSARDVLEDSGVPGQGLSDAPGLDKEFNEKSKAADNAGKK